MIVSSSLDQTSRIYSSWANPLCSGPTWHEISRAQVHGHDINSIKFLSIQSRLGPDSPRTVCDLLVCGADEKILRVLEPPAHFVNIANKFTGARLRLYFPTAEEEEAYLEDRETVLYKTKTDGGYNVLGLLVKAAKLEKVTYYYKEEEEGVEELENNFEIEYDYKLPPIEDYLFKNTLWPEVNKLYGHGYEVVCVDAKRDGSLIASCCKSQSSAHSTIFLWSPINYQVRGL
jgi:elongator complex protein 2